MIHPHECHTNHGEGHGQGGPGAVDTVSALSSLAMTTVHSAITAVQVIVNRAVWGDCPSTPANHCGCRHDHGCGYRNVRFHHHDHCC